jgi:hypothetical protein
MYVPGNHSRATMTTKQSYSVDLAVVMYAWVWSRNGLARLDLRILGAPRDTIFPWILRGRDV